MKGLICSIICSLISFVIFSQDLQLEIVVCDKTTHEPLSDVHLFVINTTIGNYSNKEGEISIAIPNDLEEDIIISHVGHELKILAYQEYSRISDGDTLFLEPVLLDLDLVVKAKRGRKWKRNLKRFESAFWGDGAAAKEVKILNSENIVFEETDGGFVATSSSPLKVENQYLGYSIDYYLTFLEWESDGSSSYLGKAKYTQLETPSKEKIEENREKEFISSSRYFLFSYAHDLPVVSSYKIEQVVIQDDKEISRTIPRDELLFQGENTGLYQLIFNDYLKVTDLSQKNVSYEDQSLGVSGLEGSRFATGGQNFRTRINYLTSYLYKLTPTLVFDKYGHILNSKAVKEYGHWADQRIARALPFNYGMDWMDDKIEELRQEVKEADPEVNQIVEVFESIAFGKGNKVTEALNYLEVNWSTSYIPPLIETLLFVKKANVESSILNLLEKKTEEKGIKSYYDWVVWLWDRDPLFNSHFADIKSQLYSRFDPKFESYFSSDRISKISLDEVLWGGVKQDGIPPLRNPVMYSAEEATYLEDDNIVFGTVINGVAKAYPKRILAWHEMVVDDFNGTSVAGVYCTLCGTVIMYDQVHNGKLHELGTSGFLYRSNKLMYDKRTQSLWNTIEGRPMIGPLAKEDISLTNYPVVTTTWKEWKSLHPKTLVLSLNTGYNRDYGEGAAYREYFSNDHLMFPVPRIDDRLANKDEVFIIRADGYKDDPKALSVNYLKVGELEIVTINDKRYVVIRTPTGYRAYESKNIEFSSFKNQKVFDDDDRAWIISEEHLSLERGEKTQLKRIPGHRMFWFAWLNAYPETTLLK